jgi:hypothetical protein
MKFRHLLPLFFACVIAVSVSAQDNYLIAKNFYIHKGAKMDVMLLAGAQFKDIDEYKYDASKTKKFMLYAPGKKINLMAAAKDSAAPVLSNIMPDGGLALVEMVRNIPPTTIEHDDYAKYLGDEGLTKLAEQVSNSNQQSFKEKRTVYMKTLVMIDKPTGGDFDKPLGEDYEIVIKQNPYKLNYGSDLVGVVYYKGKPVKAEGVDVYLKAPSGNIYADHKSTDAKGEFTITVTREGVYLLRCARTVASTGTDADFETIQTSFTFLFNSNNDDTIDYQSFGLRDREKAAVKKP